MMRSVSVALLALIACGGPTTEVVISVDTDLEVPSELDRIRFTATRADREPVERSTRLEGGELPVQLGLTHDGGPLGPVEVRVSGMLDDEVIVERRLRFDFVRGQVLSIQVELSRACIGRDCGDEETCSGGACRDIDLRPEELLPWTSDAGTCAPEVCNDADDDCDGLVDEGVDVASDPANCGVCGRRCVAGPGSVAASCRAGECVLECTEGLADCDRDPANGCEASLNSDEHCGACGQSCERFEAATECNAGRCELLACETGFRDCDGNPDTGCESSLADRDNCGGCGVPCSLFHAVSMCGTGICMLSSCEEGYDNCDGRTENGCEADVRADVFHCGGCGRRCDEDAPNASDMCAEGGCDVVCHPGWKDCDGILENGCETDLSSPESCGDCGNRCTGTDYLCSGTAAAGFECIPPPCMDPPTRCGAQCVDTEVNPQHCGGCDVACPTGPNASPECISAACQLHCDPGYGDCDDDPTNGCEVPFNDPFNCGACGRSCELPSAVAACLGGACTIAGCEPGVADCNLDAIDGCETSIASLSDCGSCGAPCARDHAVADCSTGTCRIGVCEDGWGDCDGIDANGCETPLSGCETCAGVCLLANATGECVADACEVASCDSGWGDCDGVASNGCERPLDTVGDCGGCGVSCAPDNAIPTCSTYSCQVDSCDAGFDDCDGDPDTGCESDLSDPASCGACGVGCMVDELCVAGGCRGPGDFVTVSAGGRHTCAIDATGQAWCWGEGSDGRLGQGEWADSNVPVRVLGLDDAKFIDAGANSTCAVREGGRVVCWGGNTRGQLAVTGIAFNEPTSTPIEDAVSISVGDQYACAVRTNRRIVCWGNNSSGQLGNGTIDYSDPPGDPGVGEAVAVQTGWSHTCALRTSGELLCWGGNAYGQVGDGTTANRSAPLTVGLSRVLDVDVGKDETCATTDAGVFCWGRNHHGQLGEGTTIDRLTPTAVGLVSTDVECGNDFCCAVEPARIRCWGRGDDGQLGNGDTSDSPTPTQVVGMGSGVVSTGDRHACAIDAMGLRCWGYNQRGQLGDGSRDSTDEPSALVVATP